jgi:hypothetical protein
MAVELLKLPDRNIQDIPRGLRALADKIEQGGGDCHNIAYVIDAGGGQVVCGLLGPAAECGPTAYLLYGKGMRALENG